MTIDLRKEFKDTIDNHGHWAVLRQAVPGRYCACYNSLTNEASKNCNICLSTGRAFIDRFVKLRKARSIKITQSFGTESRSPVMYVSIPDSIFYIETQYRPTQQDFIIEVELQRQTGEPIVPLKIAIAYDITDIRDMRDKGGRIEYYAVTAQRSEWVEFKTT